MIGRKLEEGPHAGKIGKLCEVLNSLADKHPYAEISDAIPYRATIEIIARELILAAYSPPPRVLTSAARDKALKLRALALTLLKNDEFNRAVPELHWALVSIASASDEELDSRMAKGRRPKANAESVARLFKTEFFRLTGNEPTSYRDGGYCAHLQTIFDALEIDARATSFLSSTRSSSAHQ